MKFKNVTNYFTKSYKHFGLFLFIVTTLVAIPFTLSILAKQQDTRSRADFQIAGDGGTQIDINSQDGQQTLQNGGNLGTVDLSQQNQNPNNNPSVNNNFTQGGQTINSQTGQTVSPNGTNLPGGYYTMNTTNGQISCGANGCYNNSGQQVNNSGVPTGNSASYTCGANGCVDANGHSVNLNSGATGAGSGSVQVYCPGVGIVQGPYCPQTNQTGTQLATNQTTQTQTNTQSQANPLTSLNIQGNFPNCNVSDQELASDPEEQRFLTLLNQYRRSQGWKEVKVSTNLNRMAAWKAADTITNKYLRHEPDSLGRSRFQEAADCGMPQPNLNSEILAAGVGNYDAQAGLNAFIGQSSPDVIKDPSIQQVGIAHYSGVGLLPIPGAASIVWALEGQSYNDGTTAPITTVGPTPVVTNTPVTVTQVPATVTQPQTTTTPTPEIGFNFTIKIPGIGNAANNNPLYSPTILQIAMFDPADPTKNVANTTSSLGYNQQNGAFNGSAGAPAGTYHVKVRTNNSLWQDLGILTVSTGLNLVPTATLTTGDLNQDNVLNLQDYNIFVSCFGTKQCSQKQIADMNQDGKVDEKDLNIFYSGLANRNGD